MKRNLLATALAALLLLAFAGTAGAWNSEIEDRPFRFKSGGGAPGYYAWHDAHGFHLWMLPGSGSHTFMGTIRTDGRFYNIRGHHLDGAESFQAYPEIGNRFWFEAASPSGESEFVGPGREAECSATRIFFKINTADASDGICFQVAGATYISFDLQMDGRGLPRNQIWYGGSSWHPETYKFKFENK
jgi:hypothetical protein